jgi:hypothetical protein
MRGFGGEGNVRHSDHSSRYRFKLAETAAERDEINRLFHRTFVIEIPRYIVPPGVDRLVDRFDHKNRYIIAVRDERVRGVMALHDRPPFSVAEILPNPAILDGLRPTPLEARMLAIEPSERQGRLLGGLLAMAFEHARSGGHRYVVASGLVARWRMYEHMGFSLMGPAVQRGQAHFLPMVLDLVDMPDRAYRTLDRCRRAAYQTPAVRSETPRRS